MPELESDECSISALNEQIKFEENVELVQHIAEGLLILTSRIVHKAEMSKVTVAETEAYLNIIKGAKQSIAIAMKTIA